MHTSPNQIKPDLVFINFNTIHDLFYLVSLFASIGTIIIILNLIVTYFYCIYKAGYNKMSCACLKVPKTLYQYVFSCFFDFASSASYFVFFSVQLLVSAFSPEGGL